MKTSRIFALILAGILLASSFTSCSKKDDEKSEDSGANVDASAVVGEDEGNFAVPEGVAEGKEFNLYIALASCKQSYIAEEETGAEINDAVYQRNALTEEWTGAKLNFVGSTRTTSGGDQGLETNQLRTWMQAGDTTYDAYVHVQHTGMPTLIEEGMFVDWNEIPYINIDNPWWYSNVERDISFGDKIFCMTGDYNLDSFSNTACIIFNKSMCDELGLEYPYQMVKDGTWTHDKFVDYIKAATKDINGDGKMTYADDRYGFSGWMYEQIPALFVGYGGEGIVKDDNNLPKMNIDNELTYTIVDKMLEVFELEGSSYISVNDGSGLDNKMFNEGRLLFNDSFFVHVPGTRELEDMDVGFVPYPKLDEDQENYYSRTANVSGLTYIPVTNTDLEKTGAVLETLAYFSGDTILSTYFDIILTIKSTRDIESEEMIPIIKDSSRFMDAIFSFSATNIITAKQGNTLSSYVAANMDAWETRLESLIELYTE
ncbi:MAG: extracellular solute-binding protein [Clostridia bacterium]|nr:extracellular solute-binding protein [Clostridia bacterium]